MKGSPVRPGDPLTSKPARSNTKECSTAPAFFFASDGEVPVLVRDVR
jgi:hypothetical protein